MTYTMCIHNLIFTIRKSVLILVCLKLNSELNIYLFYSLFIFIQMSFESFACNLDVSVK